MNAQEIAQPKLAKDYANLFGRKISGVIFYIVNGTVEWEFLEYHQENTQYVNIRSRYSSIVLTLPVVKQLYATQKSDIFKKQFYFAAPLSF
jgi:hypothetical protein